MFWEFVMKEVCLFTLFSVFLFSSISIFGFGDPMDVDGQGNRVIQIVLNQREMVKLDIMRNYRIGQADAEQFVRSIDLMGNQVHNPVQIQPVINNLVSLEEWARNTHRLGLALSCYIHIRSLERL